MPPEPDSLLWRLPNVVISPHIGGTIGNEARARFVCSDLGFARISAALRFVRFFRPASGARGPGRGAWVRLAT
jgi:hypothetical protein